MAYGISLQALADPTRRRVFELLRHGPLPVSELANVLPVSRPAVSQHLKVLLAAGLVVAERRGRQRLYSVDPSGLRELREWLDSLWDHALDNFATSLIANTLEPS
ncbi:MAG: DNA-binding transcriptional ArsR family regulator [Kiritimatiellia bacterium]|jgi:DNA-binding transcriptional ArsR family regulator